MSQKLQRGVAAIQSNPVSMVDISWSNMEHQRCVISQVGVVDVSWSNVEQLYRKVQSPWCEMEARRDPTGRAKGSLPEAAEGWCHNMPLLSVKHLFPLLYTCMPTVANTICCLITSTVILDIFIL